MTFIILFSMLANLIQPNPAVTEAEIISSTIEKATVYLSGAQVTRTAQIQLKSGTNTLVFDGLSRQFSERSIQIASDKTLTILSVQKRISEEHPFSEKLDSLEQAKENLQSQVQLKQAEETVLQRELDILISNKELKGESQNISAAEIRQAMDYFREKLQEIETSRLEISNDLQDFREQIGKIDQQIQDLNKKQNITSGQIVAEIASNQTQNVTLAVSYFLQSAGWYPSYDIRVEDIEQPLSLTYKANIYQNSGIDWENVQLSVSSAQPLSSTQVPTVQPIYLRFWQPRPAAKAQGVINEDTNMSAEMRMRDEAPSKQNFQPPSLAEVQVTQNQTSFSFDIQQPYTISGNGEAKTVSMQEHQMDANYRYLAIPKVRETAYLTAQVTEWEELNLLAGETNLYFEQTFVGQSQLQPDAPGDTLRFSLGKDEQIILERNRLREYTDKNFFGNRVRETSAWELVVRNTKNQPIDLTLVDQIPISTNEDIEVDLQERSGASLESSTGKLSWTLNVDAESTAQRTFRYRIEYPSDKQLQQ